MGKELKFLGEENFKDEMATACKAWQAKHVQEGDLVSFDGTLIHYYVARQEQPIGAIVMVHGFCEFWGKYHELAWYFYQAGY
ncbi:MAG: alpha/beta hydrolase, partial [Lachnospiraceae bacterium]|nr:alpha/beta hydrolase [Lachnospiraceae bacterium]